MKPQMYRGPGSAVSTPVYRERNKGTTSVARVERPTKLKAPVTQPLDGHPELRFKQGIKAEDIYPLSDYTYEEQDKMEIRLVKFLPTVKSEIDDVDWRLVTEERGGYNVARLTELARRYGLPVSSKDRKGDLVAMLKEYKRAEDK